MSFDLYVKLASLAAVSFTGFGVFVYLKNRKQLAARLFGLLSLGFLIWSFSWFLMLLVKNNHIQALFWARALNFGATWIPVFYLHWVIVVLGLNQKQKRLLQLSYFFTSILSIVSFTPLYVHGVKSVFYFPFWPDPGPFYIWFIVASYGTLTGYALYLTLRHINQVRPEQKYQLIYMMIGSLLGFGGGATNFLVMYNIGSFQLPAIFIGMFAVILSPFFFAYAAIKYKLMNLRVLATEGFGALIILVLLARTLTVDKTVDIVLNTITLVAASLVVIYFIRSVQKETEQSQQISQINARLSETSKELQNRNISLITLQRIIKEITRTLDFTKVVQLIADSVATELGYLGAILVFLDDDGKTVRARAITQTPLTKKALRLLPKPFAEYTTDITNPRHLNIANQAMLKGNIRILDSFPDVVSPPLPHLIAGAIQKLVGIKSIVIIPINSERNTIGVIEIGLQKKSSEISKQEIETMQSMADELGIVSRNIRLFNQIQKANKDLEVANRHLQQLDQAKSEFVSIASHQLRTPMTGIMGYLSMMVSGDFGSIDPKHLIILRTLLDESQRMIRLINLFLNVSKIEAGKFTITKKEVQLGDVIEREVNELTKIASDKKLTLTFVRPKKPLPVIVADADKLQDVFLNLIDNAIKYTTKGTITVSAEADNGGVTVHVKDTGIGIKPEDIHELFNKFVRAQGIAQIHPDGSGLGLFIAKSVVEGHGGRIWVDSGGLGKGSTFSFWLPVSGEVGTTTLKGAL